VAFELYQLKTFIAVAEAGHLTRAAEALHLSQPAVSAHVKALEEALELKLFERGPSGMRLTGAGSRLLLEAQAIVAATDRMRHIAQGLRGQISGRLRIGTVSDPEFIRIGLLLTRVLKKHPLLQIQLSNEVSGEALELVRQGALDASFYFGALDDPQIRGMRLASMTYRVVAPADWRDRVIGADWADLAQMPWILAPEISTHRQMVRTLFRRHGVEPSKVVEADQESLIESLVISGVGVSLMLEQLAREREAEGDLCVWEGAELPSTLWFIHLADRSGDHAIEAVVAALASVWGTATG
jgi:DNA-binding transcriptional LysR family regulator